MFDADLHAVLGEDDVAGGEAVLGVFADLGDAEVDLVAYEADAGHDEEQDYEREYLSNFEWTGRRVSREWAQDVVVSDMKFWDIIYPMVDAMACDIQAVAFRREILVDS